MTIRSLPFEIFNLTNPALPTLPPPPGVEEITLPTGISSLNTSSPISDFKPKSFKVADASFWVMPASDGTVILPAPKIA